MTQPSPRPHTNVAPLGQAFAALAHTAMARDSALEQSKESPRGVTSADLQLVPESPGTPPRSAQRAAPASRLRRILLGEVAAAAEAHAFWTPTRAPKGLICDGALLKLAATVAVRACTHVSLPAPQQALARAVPLCCTST